MKFKVGDKVRLLPSAVDGGVSEKVIGKVGKITDCYKGGYFDVLMNSPDRGPSSHLPWAVYPCQMTHVIEIGQQLLFNFMNEVT